MCNVDDCDDCEETGETCDIKAEHIRRIKSQNRRLNRQLDDIYELDDEDE